MKHQNPRLTLLFIFLLFGAPVVIATLMHSPWWQYRPAEMTNRGTLIQPPVSVDFTTLRFGSDERPVTAPARQWALLYPVSEPCDGDCLADIESLRQIHRATGRHQDQLVMVPLARSGSQDQTAALLEVYATFHPASDDSGQLFASLRSFADVTTDGALTPGQAFLVDPSGNIMMRYAAGFDPTDLSKDLKRLLKWSEQDG
jgi:hypothetical protein